jgi:hypothetical protein
MPARLDLPLSGRGARPDEADLAFEDLRDPYGIRFWPEFQGPRRMPHADALGRNRPAAGFSDVRPWLPVSPSHFDQSVDAQEGDAGILDARTLPALPCLPQTASGARSTSSPPTAMQSPSAAATATRKSSAPSIWARARRRSIDLGAASALVRSRWRATDFRCTEDGGAIRLAGGRGSGVGLIAEDE